MNLEVLPPLHIRMVEQHLPWCAEPGLCSGTAWGREKDTEESEVADGASGRRLMSEEMDITENLRRQTQDEGAVGSDSEDCC